MIDVDALLKNHFQESNETNNLLVKAAASVLKKLAHQDGINGFIKTSQHLEGLEFNDAVLEHLISPSRYSAKIAPIYLTSSVC